MTKGKGKEKGKAERGDAGDELIARAEALAGVLERHGLTEIEIATGEVQIRVAKGVGVGGGGVTGVGTAPAVAAPAPTTTTATTSTGKGADASDGNTSYIVSPFVGTFYRAPNPESAPFVDVGTRVKKGSVLCIVEAMKLMNEIESEVDGVITQILVDNGQSVEYGEPLFKIKQ
jgi:acetyl-CoA carboxylase biotin carboxyl carrier protein